MPDLFPSPSLAQRSEPYWRLLTAALALPPLLLLTGYGPQWLFSTVVFLLALMGLYEYLRLAVPSSFFLPYGLLWGGAVVLSMILHRMEGVGLSLGLGLLGGFLGVLGRGEYLRGGLGLGRWALSVGCWGLGVGCWGFGVLWVLFWCLGGGVCILGWVGPFGPDPFGYCLYRNLVSAFCLASGARGAVGVFGLHSGDVGGYGCLYGRPQMGEA